MSDKYDSERVQRLLKQVFDTCQMEDVSVRERQIRQYRRLKLLWEGFSNIWFSETAHDWRVWEQEADQDTDQAYYDKPINVFRAYLESLIAALSVLVPPVKCYPDDADDTLDLSTAKAGDKIGQLVYRHTDAPLIWLHALFIFVTEGMTAFYNYTDTNEKYGTYKQEIHEDSEEEKEITSCSLCNAELDFRDIDEDQPEAEANPDQSNNNEQVIPEMQMSKAMKPKTTGMTGEELEVEERNEFQPDNEDAPLHALLNAGKQLCPSCMQMMDPVIKREKFIVTRLVDTKTLPKSRQCIEVYGGLYVRVGNYARKQADAPYLVLSYEMDYSLAVEKYEHLHGNKNLVKHIKGGTAGGYNQYDQWGRLSPQYRGEYPINVVTVNNAWMRPARFNVLEDINDVKYLKKLFPDGAKAVFVNDEFAEACNESLDDHWTLTENPMSDYLYFDPLGQSLVSVQEITNDLISLTLQTIEHGIGQTFADPAVLNFNGYEQTESLPGGIYPATPKSGKSLSDAFTELRTATLSPEANIFGAQIQSLGQLASGAQPAIFGGQLEGSETASEYSMSRAQSLQRLQNTWKLFTMTWKKVFSKVIPQYIKTVQEDEKTVERNDDGDFINVFIRKAELEGKIGRVELEANENLPMTWTQKKDLLMNLMTTSNPKILEIINAPENVGLLHDALGLVDFYVPGEDDMIEQYDEIKTLLQTEAIQTGDPMNPEVTSVPIDPMYNNHVVHFEIVRKWATSEVGRQTKTDNNAGYKNVLLHGKQHFLMIQQQQMQQQMAAQAGNGATPNEKPNVKKQEAPIVGEQNVNQVT